MNRLSISPSEASRWTVCTASPGLIQQVADKLPESDDKYSGEGTTAHEAAAESVQGKPFTEDKYNDEMIECANRFGGYVLDWCEQLDVDSVITESKIPLWYQPERNGYVDVALLGDKEHLVVIDYKYGAGVCVDAVKNKQLAIYAKSLIELHKSSWDSLPKKVTMCVFQPRAREETVAKEWTIPFDEFETFCEEIEDIASSIIMGDEGIFQPSEKVCQFCPAVSLCPARANQLLTLVDTSKEEITLPAVKDLDDEFMVNVFKHSKLIEKWLKSISLHLYQKAQKEDVDGVKIVQGRGGRRAWSDEGLVEAELRKRLKKEQCYSMKVLSPAQAEKVLTPRKMKKLEQYVTKSESTTLALAEDPRPQVLINPTEEFELLK